MQLAHDLLWTIGFALIIMSVGYTIRINKERDDDNDNELKIPLDALVTLIIGIIMYLISFYIPIIH